MPDGTSHSSCDRRGRNRIVTPGISLGMAAISSISTPIITLYLLAPYLLVKLSYEYGRATTPACSSFPWLVGVAKVIGVRADS